MPLNLALDLALIPSGADLHRLIKIAQSPTLSPDRLKLHPTLAVPHLTLAFDLCEDISNGWVNHFFSNGSTKPIFGQSSLELMVTSVYQAHTTTGLVIGLNFGLHPALQLAHDLAWNNLSHLAGFVTDNLSIDALGDPSTADPITLDWIRNFPAGTGPNYQPHITLGFAANDQAIEELTQYIGQTVHFSHVGIYQLGNYCTCQKLLALSPLY